MRALRVQLHVWYDCMFSAVGWSQEDEEDPVVREIPVHLHFTPGSDVKLYVRWRSRETDRQRETEKLRETRRCGGAPGGCLHRLQSWVMFGGLWCKLVRQA
jgi:hypothetical protein